ncbi:MAG: pantoate--beta-alanine ligase [Gemmatimonadales bacterium]
MRLVRTIPEVRSAIADARRAGKIIGFVPTMGFLHEGHLSLMHRAREECGYVVVSLFVNPLQFNEPGDLARYPRDEARDAAMTEGAGVDLLFAPEAPALYPEGFSTSVTVSGVSEPLEGVTRGIGHFQGVATVVTKLFGIVAPDRAYFGQKDAQQALVIRRLVRDLDLPVDVRVLPTVREPDGLAMSSRNSLLAAGDRARAVALSRALFAAERAIQDGERNPERALAPGRAILDGAGIEPEYFVAVGAETLQTLARLGGEVLLTIAASVGGIRLIDNVPVSVP